MSHDTNITVGLLYPGEMGAAMASTLIERGVRVVTTLGGRGDETASRAREVGVEVLNSFDDVVRQSHVVVSLVTPAAAEDVALAYVAAAHLAPAGAIYVDVNSIGPELARSIGERIEAAGVAFVDAAINGLARNLTKSATLFLSGPRAAEVAQIIGQDVRVRTLGAAPDAASAMKMHLSGLSKGLCALF